MTTKSDEQLSDSAASGNGLAQSRLRRPRGRPRRMPEEPKGVRYPFTASEVEAAIAKLFCQGLPVSKIREEARKRFNIKLSREEPWRILTRIARRRGFHYGPGSDLAMSEAIHTRYPWLEIDHVKVVETADSSDVAAEGARYLLHLIQEHCQARPGTLEYHIGYAGGRCLRQLAFEFARLLCQPEQYDDFPEKIVFHSIVAGFGDEDPETDPNYFYPYFVTPAIQVKTEHVALPAPGMVDPEQIKTLKDFPLIANAFKRIDEIDVFITSASHWEDQHSTLQTLLRGSERSLAVLKDANTIGDMCWQPFSAIGPIDLGEYKPELQALVLVTLNDLHERIQKGKDVLLVLGPCGRCNKPKGSVLKAILGTRSSLINHLVVDSRTARGLFHDDTGPGQRG
jgi:DNA-binding transcriptional regulator LsrR (DeoR family)